MSSNNGRFNTGFGINQLVNQVREDPNLTPEEKEYTFTGLKSENEVQVYSEVAGLMRRLLNHPEFDLQDVRDPNGNRLQPNEYKGETITGVRGRLPVGTLKVRESSRSTSNPAAIITWKSGQNETSNPEDIEDHDASEELEADDD
ncbi:hypothetical protein [Halalkalicoccus tibetensis]|uniref:Uncharacterized protein n=1 Tax=Halalkalicoccus tibetensis TaxID=175632 RepID=A0ABD5V5L6_9EURY